jgi:hypothetical protein
MPWTELKPRRWPAFDKRRRIAAEEEVPVAH